MAGLRWSCVGVSEAAQLHVRLVGDASSQPGQLLLPENKSWLQGHFVMNQQSRLSWASRAWHCLDSSLCPKLWIQQRPGLGLQLMNSSEKGEREERRGRSVTVLPN